MYCSRHSQQDIHMPAHRRLCPQHRFLHRFRRRSQYHRHRHRRRIRKREGIQAISSVSDSYMLFGYLQKDCLPMHINAQQLGNSPQNVWLRTVMGSFFNSMIGPFGILNAPSPPILLTALSVTGGAPPASSAFGNRGMTPNIVIARSNKKRTVVR